MPDRCRGRAECCSRLNLTARASASSFGRPVGQLDDAARLRLLYELGNAFAARLDLNDLLPLVVEKCRDVIEAEGAAVLFHDRDTDELYFPYAASDDPDVTARLLRARFPSDRGVAGAVITTGRSMRVDDVALDPRFYPGVDQKTGFTTRRIIAAPLLGPHGPIGVVQCVNRRDGTPFDDGDLALLESLAASITVAIENARRYDEVKTSEARLRAQVGALRLDLARRERFGEIVGTSPAMGDVFRLMESAAGSTIAVLIEGETGVGKELVARGIHRAGPRADGPFVAVNCAALPEALLESELFGHRRGAFTGATHDQRGLFEAAAGGTIMLDEIGEMPLAMQPKLLRVLQEGEMVPVGDTRPRRVDVRVVSATNRDLNDAIARQTFRQDLFYRLAAFPIRVPPLRDRRDDVSTLAHHFLRAAADRQGRRLEGILPDALDVLVHFDWPGNVRELQNEMERAATLARDGDAIGVGHLSAKLAKPGRDRGETSPSDERPLREARAEFEARHIAGILKRHGGNVTHAAQVLGLSRAMLQRKMKDYGLR
jgi:Nif-specific regulatory protein